MSNTLSSKAFDFAAKRKGNKAAEKIGDFTIGEETFDILPVKDSGLAYLIRDISGDDPSRTISAVLDFMESALTKDSSRRFERVVLGKDGNGGLDLEEVVEVFEFVLEVVSDGANPTSPSDSSEPLRKTGSASRAKRSATA